MNSLELAIRNFLANQGIDPETIDVAMADPTFSSCMCEEVAPFINGPYGALAPLEQVAESTDEVDGYLDGYAQALTDMIQHIDNSVITVPCECAAVSVHGVLGALKRDLQAGLDSIDDVSDDEADDNLNAIRDLFSFLFGDGSVEFVALEPSQG